MGSEKVDWAINGELALNCNCTVFCPCAAARKLKQAGGAPRLCTVDFWLSRLSFACPWRAACFAHDLHDCRRPIGAC